MNQTMSSASSDKAEPKLPSKETGTIGPDHGSTRLELGRNEAIKQAILAGLAA
ncbi:hypothetical protein [Thiobacillus sp.]|uniref:hypothetical protein n=1 Tax=Thiobacillus sp. TaxID=924 RepID=UPI0025CC8DA6|nr:hypothetical protein [Thiobacillus sp.]MBT9538489.1 hypothetical protein [Thiobacillus sp.]